MRIFFLLLASCFLLLASAPSAQSQLLEHPYPDPNNPELQIPLDACNTDFIDWINTSNPVCYSKPTFRPNLQGDRKLIEQIREAEGRGGVVIDSENLANFAHSYDNATGDFTGTYKARPASSYWDNNNPAGFNSTCLEAGYNPDELDACARDLGVDQNGVRNPFSSTIALERTLPDQMYFESVLKPRIQDIVACCDGAPKGTSGAPCDGSGGYNMKTSIRSCDVARRCPTEYTSLKALESTPPGSDERKLAFQCRSFVSNMKSGLVVPAIIPNIEDWVNATCTGGAWCEFVNYLGMQIRERPTPEFGSIQLTGLQGTATNTETYFQIFNALRDNQTSISNAYNQRPNGNFQLVNSSDPDICKAEAKKMIEERIDKIGKDCAPELKLTQFSGSVCPDCGDTSTFSWNFLPFVQHIQAMITDHFQPYEIWFLFPQELETSKLFVGTDPNSITKSLLTLAYAQNIEQINNPLPMNNEPGNASVSQDVLTGETNYVPCAEGSTGRTSEGTCPEPVTERVGVNWTGDQTQNVSLEFGDPFNLFSTLSRQYLLAKDEPQHHADSCYYPRLASALPAQMGALVGALASNFSSSFCPELKSRSNLGLTKDRFNICPVASAYHIPCCYLQGVQLIESGCHPETSGSATCGNFSCCNNTTDCACGPMQVKAGWYEQLAGGENLDMCDFNDSVTLAARHMYRSKCQGWWNLCRQGAIDLEDERCAIANRYQCGTNYNWDPAMLSEERLWVTEGDLDVLSYYYGTCSPEQDTQGRGWGDLGYCGAVLAYCETGSIPGIPACTNTP